jgi:hypothetical protein
LRSHERSDITNTEFNNAGCLLISEVKFLLEHRDDTRDPPDNALVFCFEYVVCSLIICQGVQQDCRVCQSVCQVYFRRCRKCCPGVCTCFSLMGTCLRVFHIRTLRREPMLTQFETAQIANLCPVDAEEAKNCIPRFGKVIMG